MIPAETISLESPDFFKKIPHRDLFQYPPIQHPNEGEFALDARDLDLDARVGNDYTIFVSIPFCRVRCNSCPYFVSLLPQKEPDARIERYVQRLERHIDILADKARFTSGACKAVYFGGGTASLLSSEQFARLMRRLRDGLGVDDDTEVTLEGNPHEFTAAYLAAAREAGANRVSLGYQSSKQEILADRLNSPHTADEGVRALRDALAAGFRTVNVDLLYRVPGQSFAQWQEDTSFVMSLAPQSMTTYEYVVHARTVTDKRIRSGSFEAQIEREEARSWYLWLRERMLAAGYEEPSYHTFARPAHRQLYSFYSYEAGTELIGLGARSFSYVNGRHFASQATVPRYEAAIDAGLFPAEQVSRQASRRNLMERYVIFRLRRQSQVDARHFSATFHEAITDVFRDEIEYLRANGTLEVTADGIALTELGRGWRYNVLEIFYDPRLK